MSDDPRKLVWYLECRDGRRIGGILQPDALAPAKPGSMGSAVAVELAYIEDGVTKTRKFLLTCGHVVRLPAVTGNEKIGWGAVFAEICCFPPHEAHAWTSANTRPLGKPQRGMIAVPHPASPAESGGIPESERRGPNDWVLLDVQNENFQAYPAAALWGLVQPGRMMSIVGYPGGAGDEANPTWPIGMVEPLSPGSFQQNRAPAQGMLMLDGPDEARAGMSGGGIFNTDTGALLGLHRASIDITMARHSISLQHIRERLESTPWEMAPVERKKFPPEPLHPSRAILACEEPIIPFINRTKLRDNLEKITSPGSRVKLVSITGPSGSGKSYSAHLVRHVAASLGMPLSELDLSNGLTVADACFRITRDLNLSQDDMEKRVLVDGATDEAIGKKFAFWLVAAKPLAQPGNGRGILLVDGIRTTDGAISPLYDQIVVRILKEMDDSPQFNGLSVILAGDSFSLKPANRVFALDEQVEMLTEKHVSEYLGAYVRSLKRSLSEQDLTLLLLKMTGGAGGTFDAVKMAEIAQTTEKIFEDLKKKSPL